MPRWVALVVSLQVVVAAQALNGSDPPRPPLERAPEQGFDADDLVQLIKNEYGIATVDATQFGNTVVLRGTVPRRELVRPLVQLAEAHFPKVIQRITVPDRRGEVEFSIRLFKLQTDLKLAALSGLLPELVQVEGTARFGVLEPEDFLRTLKRRLKGTGNLEVLARPRITTVSGRPAAFFTGGSIPTGGNYVEVGTRVTVRPLIDGDRVHMTMRIEESYLGQGAPAAVHTDRWELEATAPVGEAVVVAWPAPSSSEKERMPEDQPFTRECRMVVVQPSMPSEVEGTPSDPDVKIDGNLGSLRRLQ